MKIIEIDLQGKVSWLRDKISMLFQSRADPVIARGHASGCEDGFTRGSMDR